ncbi:MAG: PASTA domain-containing protein, partial [Propionibacteriaceae bacterium]|nr:PASTA domain-containing protein [Propionibacteriaceae bacterium]
AATQYLPAPAAAAGGVIATATTTATRPLPADFEAGEAATPKKNKALIAVIASLAVVLVAASIGIVYWLRPKTPPPPTTVDVPTLLTMKQEDVAAELERFELKLGEVKSEPGPNDATVGCVTLQDPKAGTPVPKGSKVNITINAGPKKAKVPTGLRHQDKDTVVALLRDAGFTNVQEPKPAPTEGPDDLPNMVTSVEPAEGQEVTVDTSITIYYATGKTVMPDLTGRTRDAAMMELGRLGFRSTRIETTARTDMDPDTVYNQDPSAGVEVTRTQTTVVLYVAVEPEPTEPPPPPSTGPSPSTTETP